MQHESPLLRDPEVEVPEELLDFRNFLYLIWEHLLLPEPTVLQYEAAGWLQYGPRRRMKKAYRGFGKSYETSAYALWRLLLNPQLKILVVSAAKDRATAFSTFTKRLIEEMAILRHLAPDKDRNQRDSVIAFDVGPARAAHAPSVKSVGIFGAMTGSRADLIIADDIEIPNNSETQAMRVKLRERAKEFESVLTPNGEVVILCTDQCSESVYKQLGRFYTPRMWPARYVSVDDLDKYGDMLAPSLRDAVLVNPELGGQPSDPLRFNEDELQEREAIYGRAGFALQFMLDPQIGDDLKRPLRLRDLIIHPVDSEMGPEHLMWSDRPDKRFTELPNVGLDGDHFHTALEVVGDYIPWLGTVMIIDPSGKGKDELAVGIGSSVNGFIHIKKVTGMMGGYEDANLERIAQMCLDYKVGLVRVEDNFGQGMFTQLLKPHLKKISPKTGIDDEGIRQSKQKELRIIDTLEPLMNQHRLVIDPRVIEEDFTNIPAGVSEERGQEYRLFYQMTRITRDRGSLRHDDRLDVVQMVCQHWIEAAGIDGEMQRKARQDRLEREDWEEFKKGLMGPDKRRSRDRSGWGSGTPSTISRPNRTGKDAPPWENRSRGRRS